MRKDILHCIFLLGLFWPALACSQIILSEVSSSGSWLDEDNDGVDWIEIRNEGNDPVDLTGYLLNDDDQLQGAWTIPFSNLDPGRTRPVLSVRKGSPLFARKTGNAPPWNQTIGVTSFRTPPFRRIGTQSILTPAFGDVAPGWIWIRGR